MKPHQKKIYCDMKKMKSEDWSWIALRLKRTQKLTECIVNVIVENEKAAASVKFPAP